MGAVSRTMNFELKLLQLQRKFSVKIYYKIFLGRINQRALSSERCKKGDSQDGNSDSVKSLPKQYKFFAIGHVLLDHTARLSGSEIDILHKFHIPPNSKGELNVETLRKLKQEACQMVKCVESPGGSALNTVRILKHLGENALFIGSVGDDEAGRLLRKYFDDHKINVRLFSFKNYPTGECMSIINKDTHDEVLYAFIGASDKLTVEHIKHVEEELHFLRPPERKQIIYLEGFLIPMCQELCPYMLKNYVDGRRWLALNLSAEYIVRDNFNVIKKLVCESYFIFGNLVEFNALADKMGFGDDLDKAVKAIFDMKCGPRIMIITMDKHGIILVGNVEYGSAKEGEIFYCNCSIDPVEKVIDTTGAGDSFVAGFLHAFLNNYKLKDCVIVGSAVAAKVVTTIGCNLPEDFNIKEITDKMTKMK